MLRIRAAQFKDCRAKTWWSRSYAIKKDKGLKEIIFTGSKNASSAQKQLSQTIKEDSTRFSNILWAFKDNYKATKYVFVPDSLYRRFFFFFFFFG